MKKFLMMMAVALLIIVGVGCTVRKMLAGILAGGRLTSVVLSFCRVVWLMRL